MNKAIEQLLNKPVRKYDTAKHHREALDCMIQAAVEAVELIKANNLLKWEVIDAENELAKAVQAKNSYYWVQKGGLNAEAHKTSQTMKPVEPTFNPMMNIGDPRVDVEQKTIHDWGWSIVLTTLTHYWSNTMVLLCERQQIPTIMCYSNWAKRPLCQVSWHSLWALYGQ